MIKNYIQPMESRKSVYFNVLDVSCMASLNQATDEEFALGDMSNFKQSPRWYSKEADPVIYDPHVLVSSAHYSHIKDLKTKMRADKDTIVFIDSCGYQLATGVKPKHTRKKVLAWSESNGDLFPILDLPVNRKFSLQESIDFTAKSAKYYADNRSRTDCTIMNVLSATDSDGMEEWYSAVKDFQFDGWCYSGHGNYLKSIIQSILFLEMKGEFKKKANLHIFGTTSLSVIPYIVYAQYLLNERSIDCQLSFDSDYAFRNAGSSKYFIFPSFKGMSALVLSNKHDWSGLDSFSHFGCDCLICKNVTDAKHLFSMDSGPHFYNILGIHNYIMILRFKESIEGLISMNVPEILESLPREMGENFKYMRQAFSKMGKPGIDIIGSKFKNKVMDNGLVSKNLSSFF